MVSVFSGNDHGSNKINKGVKEYKDHPDFGYVFRENARDVLNRMNPGDTKKTLAHVASLLD